MFSLRITSRDTSMATGIPIAVNAICTIIAAVQTRPNRSVAPWLPAFARCGCTRARVARSAGSTDSIAAPTTARPAPYNSVDGLRPGVNQNGASPMVAAPLAASLAMISLMKRSAAARPSAAAIAASTSVSMRS